MVVPTYLLLSEAVKHLAEKTKEPVTVNWLLQHASSGKLRIFFMPRQFVTVDRSETTDSLKIYEAGEIYPLDRGWARWMLVQQGDNRFIEVATLPSANGQPGFVQDAATGKRCPVQVFENDLYVMSSEMDQLLEVKPLQKPDYPKWKRAELWTIVDAAYLLSGMEPISVDGSFDPDSMEVTPAEIYKNIKHAIELGKITQRGKNRTGYVYGKKVLPQDVVTWAISKYKIPEELKDFLPRVEVTGLDSLPYVSLHTSIQPYLELPLAELPESLRQRVAGMPFNLWDSISPAQRNKYASDYDYQNDSARKIERAAGWWNETMDANAWWLAESVSPLHAAMLLSRRNPNRETIEDAETNTNDEMGPEDFRRLKNIFEGARKDKQRTLKDWKEYAQQRGLKIHSWIHEWEAWVREVDARQAVLALPVTQTVTTEGQAILKKSAVDSDYEGGGKPPQDLIPLSEALNTLSASHEVTAGELAMWVCIDHALPAWSTINGHVGKRFHDADLMRLLEKDDSILDALIALNTLNVQVSKSMIAEFNPDSLNRYWNYEAAQKFIQGAVKNVEIEKKILERWRRTHANLRDGARTNGQLQIVAYVPGIGFAESIEKGVVIESEFRAFVEQVSSLVSVAKTQTAPAAYTAAKGITTQQAQTAFGGLVKISLESAMDDGKRWIEPARVSRGAKGGRHLSKWNPVLLAIALHEHKKVPKPKLNQAFFMHKFLSEWDEEWKRYSEDLT